MSLSLLERVQLKLERPIIFRGHTTMQVFQLLYLINCLVLCDILVCITHVLNCMFISTECVCINWATLRFCLDQHSTLTLKHKIPI